MASSRPGYSSNQFYFIDQIENTASKGLPPTARTANDNPEFLYPGSYIPNIYDDLSTGKLNKLTVQRGFIRGIFPEIVTKIKDKNKTKKGEVSESYRNIDPPVRRCFFQFNPSMILRSVQASSTTLNPLLQNPNQLLQAIPGQASFEFQILFNREYEVAGQVYKDGNGALRNTKPINQLLDNYGSTTGVTDPADAANNRAALPFKQDQVGDLGVLVDLYVLDSIIGQSITQDTIDSIRAYWQATKNFRSTGELDADGKPINPYAETDFMDPNGKYTKGLNNVLGNTAFLNPMPVRIVFSSLFMVEGFVTASNVAFHKFNENMVPTVCQVTLSVQALYIGFARKNSYITQQLEEQIQTDIDNNVGDTKNSKNAESLLKKHAFGKLANMGFSYAGFSDGLVEYVDSLSSYSLNTWWQAIYNVNKAKYDTDPGTFNKVRYTLGQALDTESLRFRTDPYLKKLVNENAAITSLQVENIKLFFYDSSAPDFPGWANNAEIVKESNKGNIPFGSYKGLDPVAKCKVFRLTSPWTLLSTAGNDYTKTNLSELESKKIIAGTFDDQYEVKWITDDMEAYGFDEDRIKKSPSKYFGDSVKILAQLTFRATFAGTGGGEQSVTVIKSVVRDFDPNQTYSPQTPFGIDFNFMEVE